MGGWPAGARAAAARREVLGREVSLRRYEVEVSRTEGCGCWMMLSKPSDNRGEME